MTRQSRNFTLLLKRIPNLGYCTSRVAVSVIIVLMLRLVLMLVLSISLESLAIENIGACSDYFSNRTFQITPSQSLQISKDEILIRGTLASFWSLENESLVSWAIQEKQFENIYPYHLMGLHVLEEGDRVLILNSSEDQILFDGFFNLLYPTIGLSFIKNIPFLKRKETLIGGKAFMELFHRNEVKAIVIKKSQAYQKTAKYYAQALNNLSQFERIQITPSVFHNLKRSHKIEVLKGSLKVQIRTLEYDIKEVKYITDLKNKNGEEKNYKTGWCYIISPENELLYKGEFLSLDYQLMQKLIVPENTIYLVVPSEDI